MLTQNRDMTDPVRPLPARTGKAILRWAALIGGLVVSVPAAAVTGSGVDLPAVAYRLDYDSYSHPLPEWAWGHVALCVASIILLVGATRWRIRRVNIAQVIGAAWMGLWTLFFAGLRYAFRFPGGEDIEPCVRANCWPAGVQELLAASPLLMACAAMIVVAFFAKRLNWVARALIPAAVYLAARIVQVLIWVPVVIPFLAGP